MTRINRKTLSIKVISNSEYNNKIEKCEPAEMNVNGILRGGYVSDDKFYFTGSVGSGCHELTFYNK